MTLYAVVQVLKAIGAPGSIGFLMLCCAVGLAARRLGPRSRQAGAAWLLVVFSVYAILGLPWIAGAIASRLPPVDSIRTRSSVQSVDTLVVLGGDNAVGRAEETARLYASALPRVVVVSGEQWLVDRIVELGVPADRLVIESRSRNTREQIAEVQRHVSHWSDRSVALIASRLQMPRVAGLVREAGLELILVSAPIDREPPTQGVWLFVPTYAALRVSRDALYEHAALAYYRRRGWIRAQ